MQSETKYKYTYGIMHSLQIVMRKKQRELVGLMKLLVAQVVLFVNQADQ